MLENYPQYYDYDVPAVFGFMLPWTPIWIMIISLQIKIHRHMKFHAIPYWFHWLLLFGHNPLCSSPLFSSAWNMCQMHIGFAGQGTQAKHLSHNAAYREQTRLIQIQIWSCGYIQILPIKLLRYFVFISGSAWMCVCVCSSKVFFLITNSITQTVSNIIRVELRSLLWCQSQDYVATLWSPKRPCKCLPVAKTGCFNPPEQIGVSRKKHP